MGGPATFISALAPALEEAGHRVRVFTLWDQEPAGRPPWLQGLRRFNPLPLRMAAAAAGLTRQARWADLVYINGLELPATLAARLAGRPAVLKIVGDYAWERARLRKETGLEIDPFQAARLPSRLALQRSLRAAYPRLARRIVVPSRYLAGLVEGWGVPGSRIEIIYNGLTPLPAGQTFPARRPRPEGPPLILTAARLVDWKGIDHLIQALAQMKTEAELLILGQGQERPGLEALARGLGLEGRVVFRGRVGREEVLKAMAGVDIFALPSGYEGLPHVVLEAMACGLPVVAAEAGGTPEVVDQGKTGLLVPFAQPSALALALDELAGDGRLARRMGRAGQERVGEFTWARTVDRTLDLIERTLQ